MNKKIVSASLLLATSLLCACHNNPLKTNKEAKSTQFLIQASVAASKNLKPEMDEHHRPYVYLTCMKGKETALDCASFYKAMVIFAKNSPSSAFRGINVADLTDKSVFKSLREGLEERLFFNNLDD